ncbi:unnamed protein product [Phaeothamnion confervicola]
MKRAAVFLLFVACAADRRYDGSTSIYDPKGRLYQMEYAMEATTKGCTAVGVRSSNCVVLASWKQNPSKKRAYPTRVISHLDACVAVVAAGLWSDVQHLTEMAHRLCSEHRLLYSSGLSPGRLALDLGAEQQAHTTGSRRPLAADILTAGLDGEAKPQLFRIVLTGAVQSYRAIAVGAHADKANRRLSRWALKAGGKAAAMTTTAATAASRDAATAATGSAAEAAGSSSGEHGEGAAMPPRAAADALPIDGDTALLGDRPRAFRMAAASHDESGAESGAEESLPRIVAVEDVKIAWRDADGKSDSAEEETGLLRLALAALRDATGASGGADIAGGKKAGGWPIDVAELSASVWHRGVPGGREVSPQELRLLLVGLDELEAADERSGTATSGDGALQPIAAAGPPNPHEKT